MPGRKNTQVKMIGHPFVEVGMFLERAMYVFERIIENNRW